MYTSFNLLFKLENGSMDFVSKLVENFPTPSSDKINHPNSLFPFKIEQGTIGFSDQ